MVAYHASPSHMRRMASRTSAVPHLAVPLWTLRTLTAPHALLLPQIKDLASRLGALEGAAKGAGAPLPAGTAAGGAGGDDKGPAAAAAAAAKLVDLSKIEDALKDHGEQLDALHAALANLPAGAAAAGGAAAPAADGAADGAAAPAPRGGWQYSHLHQHYIITTFHAQLTKMQ